MKIATRGLGGVILALALTLTGAGCASLEQRAPLVTAEVAATAAARGLDPQAVARGRDLYVGRCTRCHGAVAVTSRTPQQWERILPRMADEAKLEAGEMADVTAYVGAVEAVTSAGR